MILVCEEDDGSSIAFGSIGEVKAHGELTDVHNDEHEFCDGQCQKYA